MAWTDRFVASDASGGDGLLITTPWTLAEAIANAAAGMRFNVKAGTYANTTTTLTMNVAGTAIAPIMWEGYSVTPGDICGRAGVTANNSLTKPAITFTTGQLIVSGGFQRFAGLNITSAFVGGATGTVSSTSNEKFFRCRITNTGAHANARAITATNNSYFESCYFSATATAATVCSFGGGLVVGCVARGGIISYTSTSATDYFGCVADSPTTTGYSTAAQAVTLTNCSAYGGTNGALCTSATINLAATNCVFSTCTNGVNQSAGTNSVNTNVTRCQFYSVTNPIVGVQENATAADDLYVQQGNVTLTADPFVNAAAHDFSLNPASAARGAGIPGAFENETYTAVTDAGAVGNARIWTRGRA